MSLREYRRHVGRLALVGFSGLSVPDDLRRLAAAFDLGGVVYRPDNLLEPRQVAELSREVSGLAVDWPLWIAVAQEGGRVLPLQAPFTEWPPMATLGRSGDLGLADRFAAALALELRAVGVNLNLAPVLDLHTNPRNSIVGDRALSERPQEAARLGRAIVRRIQAAGVAACGKHFPGCGDASGQTATELAVIEHGPDRIATVECVPFRAAIEEDIAAILTSHVLIPSMDEERPAALSPRIVSGLLKEELGHRGVVVAGDASAGAIAAARPVPQASVDALAAGADVVLLERASADAQAAALEAVIHASESGALTPTRLDDAFARQRRMKERFAALRPERPATLDLIGATAHQSVAREMARWL